MYHATGDSKYLQNLNVVPEGKKQLERTRNKWGFNTKMDLKEISCVSVE
jgi:hypothetical protein